MTGNLGQVGLWAGLGSGCATYSLEVYAGAGTGRTKLANPGLRSKPATTTPGLFHVPLSVPIPQQAGQTYTLNFVRVSGYIATSYANAYRQRVRGQGGFSCPAQLPLRRDLPDLGALGHAPLNSDPHPGDHDDANGSVPRRLRPPVPLARRLQRRQRRRGSDGGTPVADRCQSPSKVCGGTCVDVQTDNANCGSLRQRLRRRGGLRRRHLRQPPAART